MEKSTPTVFLDNIGLLNVNSLNTEILKTLLFKLYLSVLMYPRGSKLLIIIHDPETMIQIQCLSGAIEIMRYFQK